MRDLVDTTEMYLRTVFELEEEGIVPMRARIAERLEQSGPTVSQTVARMERDGLITVQPDRSLQLTESGKELATAVMRKHRLAERLLTDIIKLDVAEVHDEACRWEHVMSEAVEKRMVEILDDPTRSPFGNPIPGLDKLGLAGSPATDSGIRAIDLPRGTTRRATITQINEILQVDANEFRKLMAAGMTVGASVTVTNDDNTIIISSDEGGSVELDNELAHAVRIELTV